MLSVPLGPPLALAPLAETTITSVLASWPVSSRNEITRPI